MNTKLPSVSSHSIISLYTAVELISVSLLPSIRGPTNLNKYIGLIPLANDP